MLWLDADERVAPESKLSIQQTIANNEANTVYSMNHLRIACSQLIYFSGWSPNWLVRLNPKQNSQYNNAILYESANTPQHVNVKKLKGSLHQYTYDSLHHYIDKRLNTLKLGLMNESVKRKLMSQQHSYMLIYFY